MFMYGMCGMLLVYRTAFYADKAKKDIQSIERYASDTY